MGLRPVIGHDVEGHRTVDDLHDLVAVRVALPRALAGKFGGIDGAVAVGRQPREGARTIGLRRLWSTSAQHPQFCHLGVEIDNREHASLRLAMTLVVLASTVVPSED